MAPKSRSARLRTAKLATFTTDCAAADPIYRQLGKRTRATSSLLGRMIVSVRILEKPKTAKGAATRKRSKKTAAKRAR